jgi:hypothetical protein
MPWGSLGAKALGRESIEVHDSFRIGGTSVEHGDNRRSALCADRRRDAERPPSLLEDGCRHGLPARDALKPLTGPIQFVPPRTSDLPNAKFTGKRRLARREDDRSEIASPASHMDDGQRLSGATIR